MAKIGRNDPCNCGSGKKYKKCCADRASQPHVDPPPVASGPPNRFAGDLWAIYNFEDANQRYAKFLQRGRPPLKNLVEGLLLYPETVVPTQDYMSLAIIIGALGYRNVLDLLEHKRLRFVRMQGSLAYVGNGGGLSSYIIGDRKSGPTIPTFMPADEAIHWALTGLNTESGGPTMVQQVLASTTHMNVADLSKTIQHETYMDILNSETLRQNFAIRNKELNHLAGIQPNQVRIYGGPDSEMQGDEVDTVLQIASANLELRLAAASGADDISTASPMGHLLKAKLERAPASSRQRALHTVREIAGIPDVGEAVVSKAVDLGDVLRLSETNSGRAFREWFHENWDKDPVAVAAEYRKILTDVPLLERSGAKTLRFLTTTGLGIALGGPIGGAIGVVVDAFDSFWLDRIARGRSPKYFVEGLQQLVSKGTQIRPLRGRDDPG